MRRNTLLVGLVVVALAVSPAGAANFIINNVDPAGVGFNDTTPASPEGGNPGTTVGELRVNAFQFAADLWGAVLDSNVDIVVQGTFSPLPCGPTSGVLGAAGTIQIFGFGPPPPPGVVANTWYHSALINSIVGEDLAPGPPDPGLLEPPFADDIVAFFNGDIGVNPDCLTGLDWYYGFDNNPAKNEVDLLNVLMHEFAHGLGFSEFASESTGALFAGFPSIYARFMRDVTTGEIFASMNDAERLAAQVNTHNLVWVGSNVTRAARRTLAPRPSVIALNPKSVRGSYEAQLASFGKALKWGPGVTGKLVEVDDGTDVTSDGCEPILNNVRGKIALIDRGACAFTQKVLNAQVAGARAAIIVNNVEKGLPPMGGSDPAVRITSVGISMADGDLLRDAAMDHAVVRVAYDGRFRAGTTEGYARLYAPDPVAPGSSKSHWDTTALPNLLMEPFITSTLKAASDLDLTPFLFMDEGWALLP